MSIESPLSTETIIGGTVVSGRTPVEGAYVRLLDAAGEYTAEVVTGDRGGFRFFARPGTWTLRALTPAGPVDSRVDAHAGQGTDVVLAV